MKRTLLFLFFPFVISQNLQAQDDFGYKTFDAGGAICANMDGNVSYSLYFAANAKTYHSFFLHAGFEKEFTDKRGYHLTEEGSGWNIGAGYRYYFAVIPKRFFVGADVTYHQAKITWSRTVTEGTTKVGLLQPSAQVGYTAVINDLFFITIHAGIGAPLMRKETGEEVRYNNSAKGLAGLSMGWRF